MADRPIHRPEERGALPRRPYKRMVTHLPAAIEYSYAFRILRAGREQYGTHLPTIRRRMLPNYQIICIERGQGWFDAGGWDGALVPGTFVALFPGIPHSFGPQPHDPMEITWLVLEGDALQDLLRATGLTPAHPAVVAGETPEPQAIFRELAQARGAYAWRAQALLWSLLAKLAAATGAGPAQAANAEREGRPRAALGSAVDGWGGDQAVARAIDLAQVHLHEPDLRLEHLARAAFLARSRFAERFRRATGTSPMAYLETLRLQEAQRLLATGTLSVADVAQRTGFRDPLYFSKRFRAVYGTPPSTYRAQHQAGPPPPARAGRAGRSSMPGG
ncbi:MAG TPA: AraC family transcriptional regulator [Chloroflexota bacterium]|nr:AraC family transcriptional regulator [Chloroflexota bacterium]